MKLFHKYIVWIAMSLGTISVSAQRGVRMAGLENDAGYTALIDEEQALARALDSLSAEMNSIRSSFRTDTLNRAANSVAILRMEEEMFDTRSRMARLSGRVNAIEQEWILKSLESGVVEAVEPDTPTTRTPETLFANLVYNAWFERNLSPEQLRELRQAQASENGIATMTADYSRRHKAMEELAEKYQDATTRIEADSLKAGFETLAHENTTLDDLIARQWGAIFDSKSYTYNYLMDKGNHAGLLEKYENGMEKLRQAQARWLGTCASDAIVNYILQKKLITDCEIWLAGETYNVAALDSLQKVRAAIPGVEELELAPVAIRERLFLEYAGITIAAPSPYNSRNPIPEVEIYPKGIIYRVLLGAFSSAQQPSVFRDIAPLAVQKGPDGKFRYFAGGFPADTTAHAAVEQMRGRGFKAPKAVVWMDGVYINLTDGEGFGPGFYRVALSGVHELTPEVREIVRTVTEDTPIVRGGEMFIVGPLDNAVMAARLRAALEGFDPEMEVKIAEISD